MTNGIYKPASFYADDGIACLRMYNIRDGVLNFDGLKRVRVTTEEYESYKLSVGDLLVNRVNSRELVGKASAVVSLSEPTIFESKNIRVILREKTVFARFANLVFLTGWMRAMIDSFSKQACGQATINQPQLYGLPVPLPPLAEQRRIVAKVEELMSLCDALEAAQREREMLARRLLGAVIAKIQQ